MKKNVTYTWDEDLQRMERGELPENPSALYSGDDGKRRPKKGEVYNVPPPPTMSLDQMVAATKMRERVEQETNRARIEEMDKWDESDLPDNPRQNSQPGFLVQLLIAIGLALLVIRLLMSVII